MNTCCILALWWAKRLLVCRNYVATYYLRVFEFILVARRTRAACGDWLRDNAPTLNQITKASAPNKTDQHVHNHRVVQCSWDAGDMSMLQKVHVAVLKWHVLHTSSYVSTCMNVSHAWLAIRLVVVTILAEKTRTLVWIYTITIKIVHLPIHIQCWLAIRLAIVTITYRKNTYFRLNLRLGWPGD